MILLGFGLNYLDMVWLFSGVKLLIFSGFPKRYDLGCLKMADRVRESTDYFFFLNTSQICQQIHS